MLISRANGLFAAAIKKQQRRWLARRAVETREWREAHVLMEQVRRLLGPMENRLRSPDLKPDCNLNRSDFEFWARVVADVVAKRSDRLKQVVPPDTDETEGSGRLLLYFPAENLVDGAAELSSNGFFDVNNIPPWDIWIDFSEGALVSWVPEEFVLRASMGVEANPEECICWVE
jgi:hypothetical protein